MAGDMWHKTCDMWDMTPDTWYVTCDPWHITGDFFSFNKKWQKVSKHQKVQKKGLKCPEMQNRVNKLGFHWIGATICIGWDN